MIRFHFDMNNVDLDYEIDVQDFEGCCGAFIIHGFPTSPINSILKEIQSQWSHNYEDFKDYYRNARKETKPTNAEFRDLFLSEIERSFPTTNDGKVYFITLIETQLWLKPLLKEKGFRQVSDRTVNSNSKNRLYVFIRDPLTLKGNKLKKRTFRD